MDAPRPGTLRHGLTCLWPSEIANQAYCEYQVHLKRLHPEAHDLSPERVNGELSHTALISDARPTTLAAINQAVESGKKLIVRE
jgi:hypothetical protein